jgi:NADP-dependent 3-hydroxy acid dehydrogenase YdfG
MATDFRGKTVLITGASSGIGRSLAVALAAQGARVGATARRADKLAELAAEVRSNGGTIETASLDVTDRQQTLDVLRGFVATLGPPDMVIANAGVSEPTGIDPMNVPGVVAMTHTNYLGVVYAFEAVLPGMLQRKSGQMVAISSMAAYRGLPGAAGYCAAKAAVSVYCESIRVELWPRGVAVTCVYPGFVETPMTAKNKHPMPWLMTADAGAAEILRRLPKKPGVLNFPRRMRFLMALSRLAPDRFIRKRVTIKVIDPQM